MQNSSTTTAKTENEGKLVLMSEKYCKMGISCENTKEKCHFTIK